VRVNFQWKPGIFIDNYLLLLFIYLFSIRKKRKRSWKNLRQAGLKISTGKLLPLLKTEKHKYWLIQIKNMAR